MKKELGIFTLLVVLCAVTGFENPRFFSQANLVNTANLIGLYGIFSIGIGMVIITGGIDLSVGSMIALNGMLLVLALTEWTWPVKSWVVSPNEIKDVRAFSEKLQQPSDAASQFLLVQFSGSFKDELAKFDGSKEKSDSLKMELAKELNAVIQGVSIYETNRFAGVSLSAQTRSLIEKDSQNTSHDKLNRLLLQDKYPDLLARVYQHWPWPFAVIFALAVPMLLGFGHGFLITKFRMQPFIVTLCGLLLYRGIARFIANDTTKGFGEAEGFKTLQNLANGKFLGLPMPFVILIGIAIVMWIILHRSIYGRYLFAVGRNEEATRFSGVNTKFVIASAYILAGLLTGISGILFAFYTNSVSPSNHGNFYELYGIAAAVLGGCSLRGGEGSIIGILIGTALLLVLQNLVNLLGIPSSLNFAVMGAVVLIGVLADQIFQNRAKKKIAHASK
jgi:ribose transport system permease protein